MQPRLSERPQSIKEFQEMFRCIYHDLNGRKYKKNKDLIARLIEEITKLMEHARKDRRALFRAQLANIFSWSMAVVNRLEIDAQESLWSKYPGICPYCLKEKDCVCGTEHPIVKNKEIVLRRLRRKRAGREPQTLTEYQKLHGRLYSWQHDRELPIVIAAHLVEEAGEVSYAHRHLEMAKKAEARDYWLGNVREETSDVISWMFALANRLQFDLADAIWEYYPYKCVKCHEVPCICKETL